MSKRSIESRAVVIWRESKCLKSISHIPNLSLFTLLILIKQKPFYFEFDTAKKSIFQINQSKFKSSVFLPTFIFIKHIYSLKSILFPWNHTRCNRQPCSCEHPAKKNDDNPKMMSFGCWATYKHRWDMLDVTPKVLKLISKNGYWWWKMIRHMR